MFASFFNEIYVVKKEYGLLLSSGSILIVNIRYTLSVIVDK